MDNLLTILAGIGFVLSLMAALSMWKTLCLKKKAKSNHVERLKTEVACSPLSAIPLRLSDWLKGMFDEASNFGWQELAGEFRSSESEASKTIRRQKRLDFGNSRHLFLEIRVMPLENDQVEVILCLHLTEGQKYLRENLRGVLCSETGETLKDGHIQFDKEDEPWIRRITGFPGERFGLIITLDNKSIREYFVI